MAPVYNPESPEASDITVAFDPVGKTNVDIVKIIITAKDAAEDEVNGKSGIKQIRNLNLNNPYMATKDEAFINENADEPFEAVFEVTDNSLFSFEIEDVAGNKTEINIDLGDKINRVPPVVTIVDPDKLPEIVEVEPKNFPDTNQDQPVTLVTDKGVYKLP